MKMRMWLGLVGVGLVGVAVVGCGDAASSPSTSEVQEQSAPSPNLPEGCAPAEGLIPQQRTFAAEPSMCLVDGKAYQATIETSHGLLHVALRPDIAPRTVNSFVNLARFHYFDGTTCHRAIAGFVVQCGDPTATGTGGPGYEFDDELEAIEPYRIGSVAMANAGPNTNGSQFFIISGDDGALLPPNYTLFGQVLDDDLGMVATLDALGNPQDGPPLEAIDIVSVTITET